jgi:hypothetical protein
MHQGPSAHNAIALKSQELAGQELDIQRFRCFARVALQPFCDVAVQAGRCNAQFAGNHIMNLPDLSARLPLPAAPPASAMY